MSRNLAASIRARLKQRADVAKQDFNLTLTHYGLERLLYRLSISAHAPNFLLKGALLFSLWYDLPHRPTLDADLLGFGPDDIDSAVATFREICQIAVTGLRSIPPRSNELSFERTLATAACGLISRLSLTARASRCKWISASAMP